MLSIVTLVCAATCVGQTGAGRCGDARDLRLVNGRIHTMNAQDTVVREVTIQNGRIAAVGSAVRNPDPCTRTIDLRGRTVVPGLIDNHNHIVLLGLRPGHDTRLENAASIADVQAAIRKRAQGLPAGAFITAMGGWNPAQFIERRLPTLAELDAAAPNHPVLVFQAFTGPAVTNTLGRRFFIDKNVAVSETGAIAGNAPSVAAINALRAVQTFEEQKRGTLDALNYGTRLGLTTHVDMGAFIPPGTEHVNDSFAFDGLATANPFTMYEAFNALHNEGKMTARLRIYFLTMDTRADVPTLGNRLRNTLPGFGDDMLRLSGVGEFATNWPLFGQVVAPTNYEAALNFVAKEGWAFQQHSVSLAEDMVAASTFEKVNAITPIADLRWSIGHVPKIDLATVNRLKAIGAGVAVHPYEYIAGGPNAGPPLRMILDSGVRAGAGSDSAQISTLNPWLNIYYMVTGKNAAGTLINAGQTITRAEALRLYTAANGWFLKEEATLGSVEVGKLGDLVVLSEDYFNATAVPDEKIKTLESTMTIVGGRVVYTRF
jgi:predicted amidohydrolase YtcJ